MKTRLRLRFLYFVLSFAFLISQFYLQRKQGWQQLLQRQQEEQEQQSPTLPTANANSTRTLSASLSNETKPGTSELNTLPAPRHANIQQQRKERRKQLRKSLRSSNSSSTPSSEKNLRSILQRVVTTKRGRKGVGGRERNSSTTTTPTRPGEQPQQEQDESNQLEYEDSEVDDSNDTIEEMQIDFNDTTTTTTTTNTTEIIEKNDTNDNVVVAAATNYTKYAYAFLIGGVHEDRPAYRGFLYNILIATHLLRKSGSTMDIWIYVQLSPDSNLLEGELPREDMRLIQGMKTNLYLKFVDRPTKESFSELVYDKFRILQLVQYQRVMFLDGDAIPLTNMDYFFQLSEDSASEGQETPLLQPNFIMASRGEPCNAGMFILEPKIGEWEELQQVIHQQHESAKDLPYPKFDREFGWGHSFIKAGDVWEGIYKNGTKWRYHASHSDQGLLYYWVKYVKQRVSIAVGNKVVKWSPGNNNSSSSSNSMSGKDIERPQPIRENELYRALHPYMAPEPMAWQEGCDRNENVSYFCTPPYREFAHFMGGKKPWQVGTGVPFFKGSDTRENHAPYRLWFATLRELNTKLDMGLDFDQMNDGIPKLQQTPLGHMAMFSDHHDRVATKHAAPETTTNRGNETTTTKVVTDEVKPIDLKSTQTTTTNTMTQLENSTLAEYYSGVKTNASNAEESKNSHSPYAYAFLIGGVHEDRPAYRGFLYDVLIAANILRKTGSVMDVWLFVQLSPDSNLTTLPTEDERLVAALNITTKYVDRPKVKETFNELVYDKFRILQMTDYRRVMFMDADAIPLTNLDYLFRLSDGDKPLLQPNFIYASRGEPCNAGLFILAPKPGEWEELQEVIAKQHESAKNLKYPKFDRNVGWGHSFLKAGDHWEGITQNGTMWKYHASHSDQGLLYYWVKYVKQRVSIAIGDNLVKWSPGPAGQPVREEQLYRGLHPFMSKKPLAWQFDCDRKDSYQCTSPYREFAHFMGGKKPWQKGIDYPRPNSTSTSDRWAAYRLWFEELKEINEMQNVGLDFNAMKGGMEGLTETPLGHMAMWRDHSARVEELTTTATRGDKKLKS